MFSPTLAILFFLSYSACNAQDPLVQLPDGTIKGHVQKSDNGNDYYAFQEIPYAAPPVGENRFKEPQNPSPWSGVLDTTKNSKICIQVDTVGLLNTTEDCLYLNVYTTQINNENDPLPVLVWIHGGSYLTGSGAFYLPQWLMDYEMVVVTINYRLGPFGFLNTMDGVIPGNLGLKDQRQALRWVNKNIHLFGGDPTKVTIAGESAGAFSTSFHLLSQNSEGLFRAAIQQSGTSMSQVAFTDRAKDFAFQLGTALDSGFNGTSADLLDILQKASASDILSNGLQVHDLEQKSLGYLTNLVWTPVIEDSSTSEDPFVTTLIYDSFIKGDFKSVPTLLGFNTEESLLFLYGRDCFFAKDYDTNASLMVGSKLNVASENGESFGTALRKIYANNVFENNTAACVKYSSDATFLNPIVRQAECTSKFAHTYLYQFGYMGQMAEALIFPDGRPVIAGATGVGHGEDLTYFWKLLGREVSTISDNDKLIAKQMQTMWANFVKYLNPTPEPVELLQNVIWRNLDTAVGLVQFLNIDADGFLQMRANPRYYDQVSAYFEKYQEAPFVTW